MKQSILKRKSAADEEFDGKGPASDKVTHVTFSEQVTIAQATVCDRTLLKPWLRWKHCKACRRWKDRELTLYKATEMETHYSSRLNTSYKHDIPTQLKLIAGPRLNKIHIKSLKRRIGGVVDLLNCEHEHPLASQCSTDTLPLTSVANVTQITALEADEHDKITCTIAPGQTATVDGEGFVCESPGIGSEG